MLYVKNPDGTVTGPHHHSDDRNMAAPGARTAEQKLADALGVDLSDVVEGPEPQGPMKWDGSEIVRDTANEVEKPYETGVVPGLIAKLDAGTASVRDLLLLHRYLGNQYLNAPILPGPSARETRLEELRAKLQAETATDREKDEALRLLIGPDTP